MAEDGTAQNYRCENLKFYLTCRPGSGKMLVTISKICAKT
jgi:hypothetical protein